MADVFCSDQPGMRKTESGADRAGADEALAGFERGVYAKGQRSTSAQTKNGKDPEQLPVDVALARHFRAAVCNLLRTLAEGSRVVRGYGAEHVGHRRFRRISTTGVRSSPLLSHWRREELRHAGGGVCSAASNRIARSGAADTLCRQSPSRKIG
jgi:hypothetical protein